MVATLERPAEALVLPEKKRLWLLDFDDTLIPYLENMIILHNQMHNTELRLDDIVTFRLSDNLGYDDAYWDAEIDRQHDTGRTFNISPHKFAMEALASAIDKNQYQILTSRRVRYEPNMRGWLLIHDRDELIDRGQGQIHMNGSTENLNDSPHDKGEIAKSLGAYALVDDHYKNVMSADNNGVRGILFGDSIRVQKALEKHKYLEHAENWMEMWEKLNE